jgi:hypothetical protein
VAVAVEVAGEQALRVAADVDYGGRSGRERPGAVTEEHRQVTGAVARDREVVMAISVEVGDRHGTGERGDRER